MCLLLAILLFDMVPQPSAKALSSDAKLKKAGLCLTEEIHVLDQLPSDVRYSDTGHEFNVKSMIYIK